MELQDATILIRHASDSDARSVMTELASIGSTRILRNYFEFEVGGLDFAGTDFDVTYFSNVGKLECRLLDQLSRLGSIGLIRLVSINAAYGDDEQVVGEIARAIDKIKQSLGQLLGARVRVLEARIGIRGFGEAIPSADFFPISVDSNVMVIPHDRISDSGMARPISRGARDGDTHSFALHGAIEIASLLGLWQSMNHAPIDGFAPKVAGSAISRLRFSQSRVRILIGPPLPMSALATPDVDLPLPLQHFPVANIQRAVTDLVDAIYPPDLHFNKSGEPDFTKEVRGGVSGLVQFLKEFCRSVVLLPRFVVTGLRGEIDNAASNFYQGILADDTMVRVVGASNRTDDSRVGLTKAEFEGLVEAIVSKTDRELVSPLTREHWQAILGRFLGAFDGHPQTKDVRQRLFGNENLLLVNRNAVGHCADAFEDQLELLLSSNKVGDDDQETSRPPEILGEIEGNPVGDSQVVTLPVVEADKVDVEESADKNLAPDDPKNSSGDKEQAREEVSIAIEKGPQEIPEKVQPMELVAQLSARFMAERNVAASHGKSMVARIQDIVAELRRKDSTNVSSSVVVAAWVSLCAIVFAILTCTPLRKPLSFSSLSGYARDVSWTAFSGVFIIAAIFLLGYGGKRTWQVRALITGGVAGLIIAIGIVWFDDLRDAVQVEKGNYVVAAILGVGTLVLLGVAVFRNLSSSSEIRRQLGRLFLLLASIYLLVSLVLWQCMESSALQQADPSTRTKLLWAILIVAGLLLVSCLGVVALLQIRERLRLRVNAKILEWAKQELETAIEAERILSSAHVQWAATGSVLSRLLTYPLGNQAAVSNDLVESLSSDESILKYDVARLHLNTQGDAGLVARLRRHFVEPGWLIRQYEKMVRQFQEQAAFSSGNRVEDLIERRPELDPTVVTPDQALMASPSGDRWEFARRVFAGEYDNVLGSVPDQLDLEEVYQSVLDSPTSYRIEGSQLQNASAREFLEQVLPTPGIELATGLTKRVFTAGDELRKMKSEVWWPSDILGDPTVQVGDVVVNPSDSELSSFFGGAVLLVGIRVDFSEPFSYVDCEGAQEFRSETLKFEPGESGQSDF